MSIQEHLNKIRNAIKGSEVRESIAKGIETAYDDASEKDNANMEVKIARGTNPNLNTRLNNMDATDSQNTKKIDSNHQEVTAQLAQKAQELDIKKRDKNVPIGLNDADGELLAAIEGGEGTTFDLESVPRDLSVTPKKTTFMERNYENLFDGEYIDLVLIGNMTSMSLHPRGHIGIDSRMTIIPIKPHTTYTFKNHEPEKSSFLRIATSGIFPDVSGGTFTNLTPLFNSGSLTQVTFTTEADDEFVLISVDAQGREPKIKLEENDVATEYTPPYYFKNDLLKINSDIDDFLTTENSEWVI